ncbi:hypothetical protein [Bacillus sp. Marseille-P3661]|uniref:hypothetical protein n=1 Tax=Bacillus sp. Marseille-P3661 TaxID=1936234 RepID=UPI000C84FBC5|nr:hypothetical protein [Bacillus sp. Marseille-P3661]
MAFSIFFALTVIINLTYAVSKKNLHLFEIFFIWMVTNIIHHNFMTIFALNMEMINFNSHSTSYWTMALIRVFLIPVLIIWYIDKIQGAKNRENWIMLFILIPLLIGIEYLANLLNVYDFVKWNLFYSIIEWVVILLLISYLSTSFRKILRKEMS